MDKKVKGSWLIYQTAKLQRVVDVTSFENTYLAGKAGVLLSALSGDKESTLDNEKVLALAKASGINSRTELPIILETLESRGLVDKGASGIGVLGVTTATTLQHTADIFDDLAPSPVEQAAISLSELASERPRRSDQVLEQLSDEHTLPARDANLLLRDSEEIGFVDVEEIDKSTRLLFNGNLFRRAETEKVTKVLDALSHQEAQRVAELNATLEKQACMTARAAEKILGKPLFDKVASVGLYDVSIVSNDTEEVAYVTKPAAFSKYSNSMIDDAFDLAKMFVSSLTYGMTRSSYTRGQITMIEALLGALIRGEAVGPVPAIGQDYRILEMKNVIEVYRGSKKGRSGYMMRLLKKEVGVLALEVIANADASAHSLENLPSAAVNRFRGPEENREVRRRRMVTRSPKATNDILLALRTGGKIR